MSSPLALATAMRAVSALIDAAVSAASLDTLLGTALTTVHAPDLVPVGESVESDHLNLFLYTVTVNPGWRTLAPVRSADGTRVARPPLALDLHFLLTAYGGAAYHPEILLGIGMQALHEQPFLDRASLRAMFAAPTTPEDTALATAGLDQQVEQVRLAPHDLSADDLYKLWSAFGSKCRPSAAYVATVVLIDSRAPIASGPPVLSRNLAVLAFEPPSLAAVTPQVFAFAGPTIQLTLTGSGLATPPGNVVLVGDTPLVPDSATPDTLLVTVPTSAVVPGLNLLRLATTVQIGAPPAKTIGGSNPVAITVQPAIAGLGAKTVDGVPHVSLTVTPACNPAGPVTLLLDPAGAPGTTGYAIDTDAAGIAGAVVTFAVPGVPAGTYLARLRAGGAESVPQFTAGTGFTGPTVTL